MTALFNRGSVAGPRRATAAVTLLLACSLVLPPAVAGATVVGSWAAKVGPSGVNGTASLRLLDAGTGSLVLRLARFSPSTLLPVVLHKGTCSALGPVLLRLFSIRTSSTGAAARASTLTVAQMNAIRAATKGTGRIALRAGSGSAARCGTLVTLIKPPALVTIAATIPVSYLSQDITVDPTGVWVAGSEDGALVRIDPASNKVVDHLALSSAATGDPVEVGSGFGSLWVGMGMPGSILRVDPVSRAVTASMAGPDNPSLEVGPDAVWVVGYDSGAVVRLNPTTNQAPTVAYVGKGAAKIAVGEGGVWISNMLTGEVIRLDPISGQVTATIAVGGEPHGIVTGAGSVWVVDRVDNGRLLRIDPATNLVARVIPVGPRPSHVGFSGGYVWVGMSGETSVLQVNAATMTVVGRLPIPGRALEVATSGRDVWVVSPWQGIDPPIGVVDPSTAGAVTRLSY